MRKNTYRSPILTCEHDAHISGGNHGNKQIKFVDQN